MADVVNNNVAHVALHQDSGHGFEMSVRNLNFSMQSNCLQSYSHPAAAILKQDF
jgi:hypothetical protein